MTLDQFIEDLLELQKQGCGHMRVFYRMGSSGDCGALSYPSVSDHFDECGPFGIEEGYPYISVYAGN